jgi:hypothetical protein
MSSLVHFRNILHLAPKKFTKKFVQVNDIGSRCPRSRQSLFACRASTKRVFVDCGGFWGDENVIGGAWSLLSRWLGFGEDPGDRFACRWLLNHDWGACFGMVVATDP